MRSNLLIFLAMLSCQLLSAQIVSNGLVAKYSFNNGNANDEVGSNNGTVSSAALTTDRFGNTNKAYNFAGNASINLGNSALIQNLTTSFTLSVWFRKTATSPSTECLLCKWGYSPNKDHFLIGTSNNTLVYAVSGPADGGVFDTTSYPLNDWNHFVLSWESAGIHKLYLNGALLRSDTLGAHTINLSQPVDFLIGAQSAGIRHFNGDIDDVRVYNRVLTIAEVDSLFNELNPATVNLSQDLAGHWSFNNADATDETANNNDGVINGAVLVQDRFGNPNKAYSFSQGQYISVPDADTLDGMTSGFSLSFWVLAPDVNSGTSNNLISKFTHCSGSGDDSYNLRINSAGQLWAQIDDAGGNDMYQVSNAVIDDSSWHHIALVWNRPNVMVYIDGVADLAGAYSGFNFDFNNSPEVLAFGHQVTDACGGAYQYGELLDDIRLYNRAINATEVDSLFNEPNPVTTATTEVELTNSIISFFPNPSSGLINYSAAANIEEIEVLNLAGQRVATLRPQGRQGQISLDLNAGLYLLRSRLSDGTVQSDKLVIQK